LEGVGGKAGEELCKVSVKMRGFLVLVELMRRAPLWAVFDFLTTKLFLGKNRVKQHTTS
jgi:hypothetical protein